MDRTYIIIGRYARPNGNIDIIPGNTQFGGKDEFPKTDVTAARRVLLHYLTKKKAGDCLL